MHYEKKATGVGCSVLHDRRSTRRESSLVKRIVAVLAVLATLSLSASSAGAASPESKQIKALQKQVTVLQKSVKTLQKQVKIVDAEAYYNFTATACTLAMTADLFQATWTVINPLSATSPFTALVSTPIGDYNACSVLKLIRTPGATLTPYTSLISLLYGTA